jgi:hypothetical protein
VSLYFFESVAITTVRSTFKRIYFTLPKSIRDERNERYEALQEEESINTRINEFRKVLEEKLEIPEFDRDIMDSLIDKVVIGATDEDGNSNPYVVTFVFKAGMKFNEEFYEKIANPSGIIEEGNLSTYALSDKQLACTYGSHTTCGDSCLVVPKESG